MKTASFHTTARKAILATLQQADRDGLRVRDAHGWRALTDEELQRLDHAKTSDVSYEVDSDNFDMFDGTWRADVDCGCPMPHASEYGVCGMDIAFDGKTVWETVCAGLVLLDRE